MTTSIYKILTPDEWAQFSAQGTFTGTAADLHAGFIHMSAASQVAETLARRYAHIAEVVLLQIDTAALGSALRWEASRGGELYPHVYRTITLDDLLLAAPLQAQDRKRLQGRADEVTRWGTTPWALLPRAT